MQRKSILTLFAAGAITCSAILPYQDSSLSPEERAADLCSRLTLEEKAQLMMNSSPAIERLGIPAFEWWSEALHGVARNGLSTVFPSCIGMAASFDDDLIEKIFSAVGDEARAKNNMARQKGEMGKYKGLSFWTPTVNIFRDPRWGRGQESYGEDPYMNGRMGLRVVRGLQGPSDARYKKLLACAKHFAVHSGPEKSRHSFNIENLPARDLWESYMPAFKVLIQQGDVREVMCAYQRFEGQACCGSDRLLQQILRDEWGFNGVVVSDCGAINDFYLPKRHDVAADAPAAAALGALSGTDVECGSIYKNIPAAVIRGDISEADVDINVKRLLAERFRVGDFDHGNAVKWAQIPASTIASDDHRALARQMAREQCVLLKNDGILPLRRDANVMVMGPNATDSTMQWGIYYGQPAYTVTMLHGMRNISERDLPYYNGSTITALSESVSIMDVFSDASGRKGMHATYWNNTDMAGSPAAEAHYASPILLDNGGNTAFAPGVELTDFTVRFKGSFIAEADETLTMVYNNDDGMRIIVNGDTVHNRWKHDSLNFRSRPLDVKKGQKYDIELNYMQLKDDATFNFDLRRTREVSIPQIVEKASDADIVVFFGGISPALEREQAKVTEPGFDNGDRTSIELPQCQRDILAALHAAGKKVILVNCSGSAIALTPEDKTCNAILQAWYPGEEGGNAVAEIIYGDVNPSGKLPVTFYTCDAQLPPFEEYRMDGRTYRYMHEKPLYHFGHGLSYTTFKYSRPRYKDGKVTVDVKNTGNIDGCEIVQLYLRRPADKEGPNKTLRGYARVNLKAGEMQKVCIDMPADNFEVWDESSQRMAVIPGEYELLIGSSSDPDDLQKIKVKI
ncbi:MAG: glycoside hydrolase family 3 C-terminal domain-containing protein [Muribaculaceae bacterium]|nr:glycoside hydrolase family 3 C-terminal domain-containing protein [Muribaculaceae bacterium]